MDKLAALFSSIPGFQDAAEQAQRSYDRDMLAPRSQNIRAVPPDPNETTGMADTLYEGLKDLDGSSDTDLFHEKIAEMALSMPLTHPPPKILPCAKIDVARHNICSKPGTMACSGCCLVSYCSPECQREHWRHHKSDCKNQMRSPDWVPGWIRENRRPTFINDSPLPSVVHDFLDKEIQIAEGDGFSIGLSLWGNIPAMDLVNLPNNENDLKRDLSLAFVASGDLRNVVRTVNSLPSDYAGNLNILINDGAPPIVCRNLVLLLVLGTISDETSAADIALHFWYSVFIPMDYRLKISSTVSNFAKRHGSRPYPLGPRSAISCFLSEAVHEEFLHYTSQSLSLDDIQVEYDRVRTAPERQDLRDRMYQRLRPSHRVAFEEFRRFGIVLPFGALNAHFNLPNLSLFSSKGKWLQTDYADPLEAWDLDEVVKAGKAHGAKPEDIYGCFFFFLSQELREFARRIRKLRVSFHVYCAEACKLSEAIQKDKFSPFGLPASIRFDRIEVSNILDSNYVGLQGVLTHWGPLLTENRFAALVGYFMNWPALQTDGVPAGAERDVMKKLIGQLLDKRYGNVKKRTPDLKEIQTLMITGMHDIGALYENSKPFSKFLQKQGLNHVLKQTKLKLRDINRIVPHRLRAPLGAKINALPEFPDDDTWYYHTQLSSFTWSERFVEFERQ